MSDNVVQVSIRGDASSLSSATKEAGSAMGGLTDSLKEWRTHVRTEARYTNFMAAQISGLGIASKGAAAELTGLVSAFAFGGGLGVGVELVKMVAHAFHDLSEAEAAAREEMKKFSDDLVAGTKKVEEWSKMTLMALRGASQAQMKAEQDIKPLLDEREKKQKEIALLESNVASAREDEATNEFEAMQKIAPEDEKKLARLREEVRLLTESINKRQVAEGAVATEQIGQDTAKGAEDEAKRLKQKEKLRQEHLMRVSRAEYEAAKALEKMHTDQLAQRVQIDENFGKIDDENQADKDKNAKDRFEELKKQIHSGIGEATRFGAAFGTALAGIAAGTVPVTKAFADMTKAALHLILDSVRKAIEAYALQAAAAAAAANAGVPFGIFIAAGAAAAMEALVMGLLGSLPSAAVGMPYVPRDMPVFVHQGERILTANENKQYGGGGGEIHLHVHSLYADRDSLRHLPEDPNFQRGIREAIRNGHL